MVQVSFEADEGFEVTTAYKLRSGIYVVPVSLERDHGAVKVHYPREHEGEKQVYASTLWNDGGYSLRGSRGDSLDPFVVSHIGYAVHLLANPFAQPSGTHLSAIE